jgi:hypothetical protein
LGVKMSAPQTARLHAFLSCRSGHAHSEAATAKEKQERYRKAKYLL